MASLVWNTWSIVYALTGLVALGVLAAYLFRIGQRPAPAVEAPPAAPPGEAPPPDRPAETPAEAAPPPADAPRPPE